MSSRFAWECIGSPAFPGPGADGDLCWLCGGPVLERPAWPVSVIPDTFTNFNQARALWSGALCQPCWYMSSKAGWEDYLARSGIDAKSGHSMSWRSYSHVFWPGHHEIGRRDVLRRVLLDPPDPPFLVVVAVSGQKHLIFRSLPARSRDVFPVQYEEEQVWVNRELFRRILAVVERARLLGLSQEEVVHGRLRSDRYRNLQEVMRLEEELRAYRRAVPTVVELAYYVSRKEAGDGRDG